MKKEMTAMARSYSQIEEEVKKVNAGILTGQEKSVNEQHDATAAAIRDTYTQQIDDTEKDYNDQYGVNAIQQKINENAIAEANANLGLTRSGLNAMQQTATVLARGNADRQVTEAKQKAVDTLAQKMAALLADNETSRNASLASAKTSWEQGVAERATSMYNQEVESDTALQKAQIEAETAITKAALEAEIKKAEDAAKNTYAYQGVDPEDDKKSVFVRDGKTYSVQTGVNPYNGKQNANVEYGTFTNGYQPDNVGLIAKHVESKTGNGLINGALETFWGNIVSNKADEIVKNGITYEINRLRETTVPYENGQRIKAYVDKKDRYWIWNEEKNEYEELEAVKK